MTPTPPNDNEQEKMPKPDTSSGSIDAGSNPARSSLSHPAFPPVDNAHVEKGCEQFESNNPDFPDSCSPPPNEEEHNPDGLTPEQYGAPEWRLLTKEEYGKGFEHEIHRTVERWMPNSWAPFGSSWFPFITYRRRVSPAPSPALTADVQEQPSTGFANIDGKLTHLDSAFDALTEEQNYAERTAFLKGGDEPCAPHSASSQQEPANVSICESIQPGTALAAEGASNAPVAVQSGDQGQPCPQCARLSARLEEVERKLWETHQKLQAADVASLKADQDIALINESRARLTAELSTARQQLAVCEKDREAAKDLITSLVERRSDPHGYYYVSKHMGGLGSVLSQDIEQQLSRLISTARQPEEVSK